jgi:hypothetical protein
LDNDLRITYAKTQDGLHIAYGVMGEGPPDLVHLVGSTTHLRLSQIDSSERLV